MRILLLILTLLTSLTSLGQNKTQVITLTDIHVESVEGESFFIGYEDSSGTWHADMRFENYDVYVDGIILFDYNDDILASFNEEYARYLIGKKVTMVYYEKYIKYFGVVPYVVELKLKN
jgi:hypothetical protein